MKNLIIRPKGIGDIVLMIPVLQSLLKNYPDDEFTLLCYKGFGLVLPPQLKIKVIEFNPHESFFDALKLIKRIRREKFDRVFDLFGNLRTAIQTLLSGTKERYGFKYRYRHIAYNHKYSLGAEDIHQTLLYCNFFKKFGFNCENNQPEFKIPFNIIEKAKDAIPKEYSNLKPFIAINPNSKYLIKTWPEENVIDFINLWYEKKKIPVMITFGPGEENTAKNIVNKVGKEKAFLHNPTKLNEFVGLLSLLDVFITCDSGPMHIAWANGTKVVSLFGPTNEIHLKPLGDQNIALITNTLDCLRCYKSYCPHRKCMYAITPQMVLEAVETLLK